MSRKDVGGEDAVDEMFAHFERLNEAVKIDGEVMAIKTGGLVVPYEIPLEALDTAQGILSWAGHLSDKTWIDRQVLGHFIKKAANRANIDLRV